MLYILIFYGSFALISFIIMLYFLASAPKCAVIKKGVTDYRKQVK
jgi:hypothetical protein